jgi:DNA-binding GntR family transcriptional regulator
MNFKNTLARRLAIEVAHPSKKDDLENKIMQTNNKTKAHSLADTVYENLKQMIQSGQYLPGSKLVIQDVADMMGISRTPVVLAINRLAAEGYADSVPQQGTFVKSLTIKYIRDILELRLMIDIYSVDGAIRNMAFDHASMADLREAVKGYSDIGPRDYDKARRVEEQFHHAFIRLAGNMEILRVYQNNRCVEMTYQLYRLAGMELNTVQTAYEEHVRILECLDRQAEDEAKTLLTKHLRIPLNMLDWLVSSGRTFEGIQCP